VSETQADLNQPDTQDGGSARPPRIRLAIGVGSAALILIGAGLLWRMESGVNKVALSSEPKRVTVVAARAATYRPSHRYVGTLNPWVEAKVGPQFVSAYVDTVLVRPGATVKRGDVLATLDCRNASALNKAVASEARAVQSMQEAVQHEAERLAQLQDGGFVSPNEIEQKTADSAAKQSQYLALQAQMLDSTLKVNDCVLRAPFDGEVADRMADPGAFAKPGNSIVSIVDRDVVRLVTDVPEDDFASVATGTRVSIHVLATGDSFNLPISRRTPAADLDTRTIHIEVDIPDPERRLPVYATAEVTVDVGNAEPATELPLAAASIRGAKADVFTVKDGKALPETFAVVGERAGGLFVDPALVAGTLVVLEGRALLKRDDPVVYKEISPNEKVAEEGRAEKGNEDGTPGAP
jgi:RND family efflux transporter MFP subunit